MNRDELFGHPGIAAVLSFFITGLGQIYNGQILKGLLFIIIQMINGLLMYVIVGFITFPLFWLYGMYDAYSVAARKQRRQQLYGYGPRW